MKRYIKNIDELKEFIIKNGCFPEEENRQIFEKWFANGPRYLFRPINRKYQITTKILCDIGCSYGTNLIFCSRESYGIEIDKRKIELAKSIGLLVYERDLQKEEIDDLPKVEIVWCSAVLEHLESPYIFLKKINQLLKSNGLEFIYVSTIPLFPWLRFTPVLGKFVSGYNNNDHLYAFVPSTLKFICERAGFKTVELSPFYPGLFKSFNPIPFINRLVGRIVYVGKKLQ